jgi:hypothetical protein
VTAWFRYLAVVVVATALLYLGAKVHALNAQIATLEKQVQTLSASPLLAIGANRKLTHAERVQRVREAAESIEDYLAAANELMDEKSSKSRSATVPRSPQSTRGASPTGPARQP